MGDNDVSWEFTMLDGFSMVLGAAIASVHLRMAQLQPRSALGWVFLIALLGGLSLTATGPFLYLSRRFLARPSLGYPQFGDRLWTLWGCPWIISALVTAVFPSEPHSGRVDPVYVGTLGLGLFLASSVAIPILAARYIWADFGLTRRPPGMRWSWSDRVGRALTATWPIQVGVGLFLMG